MVLTLAAGGGGALAQLSERQVAEARIAARQLLESVSQAEGGGVTPVLSTPKIAMLFDRALPEGAMFGPPAPIGEFALISELAADAAAISRAYLLAGIKSDEAVELSRDEWKTAGRNFLEYLPEIARLYDFRLRASSRLAAGAAQYGETATAGAKADSRIDEGIAAIERESTATLVMFLSCSSDASIDAKWRRERLQTLLSTTAQFAALLDLKQSQEIADLALAAAIRESDREAARMLKDFALAILR